MAPVVKPLVHFPDATLVTITYLRSVLPGIHIDHLVPVPAPPQFVKVKRIGGARKHLILDRPRMDIQCWAASEGEAADLMMIVRPLILAMAGKRSGTTIYDVVEVSGPMPLWDEATGKPKYAFAVDFSMRGTEKTA